MNVLKLAEAYSDMTDDELDAALQAAKKTQAEAVEGDNEFVFLQQDQVIQAIHLVMSKRPG